MLRLFFPFFLSLSLIPAFSQINNAELTFQQTDIFFKNGKLIENITYEIKILNRAGEEYTNVSIPYSKLIKITRLEAWIKDTSGTVIKKIEKSEIKDRSAISEMSLYEDDFVKEFTLKHNRYPYSIFYTYQLEQSEFLQIEYWMPVISREVPTRKAILNVQAPKGYKVLFKSQLIDTFTADSLDSQIKYTWKASYKGLIENELYSPPSISFIPHVIIVPCKFNYHVPGSFETWVTYGDWNNDLLRGLSDLPATEKTVILNLIKDITDTKQKIETLYNYLQNHTRYINVTIGTGGLKPYPASYVAENKYGDCKALSNYFKAILEAAGINSFYTKVNAGAPEVRIDKSFPSQQFNHIILCLPVENDTIWLDCTSDYPFNYLGTFTQNRDVFIIEKNRSKFTRTPSLSNDDVRETRKVGIHQNSQNQAIGIFLNSYRGEEYEALYYLTHSLSESQKAQIFRRKYVEAGFELSDYNIKEPDRDSAEISLSYIAVSDKVYKVYGNDLLIDILPFSLPRLEDPKNRKLPIQIDYPVYKTDTLEYEIPSDFSLSGDLINQKIVSDFGSYDIISIRENNKVEIIKNFLLYAGEYPLDRYNDLYKFISDVRDAEKNNKLITSKNFK